MNQPVPKVSAADVERILQREFPTSADQARALLEQYGRAEWERGSGIHRVRLACLKLAGRDLQKLARAVELACTDYRDVLASAEYASYMRFDQNPSHDIPEKSNAIKTDWEQYQNWFATGVQVRPPPREPAEIKKQMRQVARLVVAALTPDQQKYLSRRACELFLSQDVYARAKSILLYMPLQAELDVRLIYERATSDGKDLALPRFVPEISAYGAYFVGDEPLAPGAFGALEPSDNNPVPVNRLDLIVAPGLAFDARGRRLGRGKGFYDRLLCTTTGVKCGICFDEQLLAEIPVEPHDIHLDFVATPTRWIDCRGSTPEMK
jgi:5-formyltetrahydrofolate cyclo-ligase